MNLMDKVVQAERAIARKIAIDQVLEIINEIDEWCCIKIGTITYSGGKEELERRIKRLLEDKTE